MEYVKKALVLVAVISLLFAASGSGADVPLRVGILPFQMNAPGDLSYLREGIMDMLSSRLAWEGKVEVIEKQLVEDALAGYQGPPNEAAARQVGVSLDVDYVLFGSLTVFGESVSIDAKMLALKEDRPPVIIYAQTKGMSEVIPRINDFAQDINNKIFGRGSTEVTATPVQPRFSKAHPESLMTRPAPDAPEPADISSFVDLESDTLEPEDISSSVELESDTLEPEDISSSVELESETLEPKDSSSFVELESETLEPKDSSSFVELESDKERGSDVFRSQKLQFPVNSMDVGDLDGDGRPEIVVLSKFKEAIVYQWDQARLNKRGSFRGSGRDRLVWVCLMDANHDRRAEVYISNLRGQRLSSYVLEWKGEKLQESASQLQWYFNRLAVPGKDTILMGQKKNTQNIFTPGIYHLQFAGGSCKPLEGIGVPSRRINLFNFTQGDLDGDGKVETVFIGAEERLYLVDDDGTGLWESRDYYGATSNILEGKEPVSSIDGATIEDEVETYYIPSPILLVDLNNDKRPEILANRNVSLTSRILARFRNFSDGEIQSMIWTGQDLLPQWKTRPLRGMVVSYRLADMDGDGQEELVAAAVLEKQTFQETKSMIYLYELDQVRPLSGKTTAPGIIESNF